MQYLCHPADDGSTPVYTTSRWRILRLHMLYGLPILLPLCGITSVHPQAHSHAMLMVFLLIMPGVMSGLGNLLVPIQLCVPEMVFPKVNNLGTTALVTAPRCHTSCSTICILC